MRIGIDLGGTKIESAVLADSGQLVARRRLATPHNSYLAIISNVAKLVRALEADAGQGCSVGVGMPGILSPHSGLVKNSNTTVLNGKPLDRDLSALLDRELRFENDANCFALSEVVDGAVQGHAVVFGVIIGTGTGGGIAIDRKVMRGKNRIAGEWGHNPLPWASADEQNGPTCYCGRRGCLETFLSGAGLRRAFANRRGGGFEPPEIARLANAREPDCVAALEIYADRLARGLATVVNVVDPDAIVVGGGLSNLEIFYEMVPPLLQRYAFSDQLDVLIVRAQHGDSSGVRGAAWLWPD
jgi:fructokinase